jgi:UDP-N-acetylmuramoyl-tripeptide--D-alanyl-D-alanine ligase
METLKRVYNLFLAGAPLCTDSRAVEIGSIFFGLKGDNFDGNKFALQALEKGASIAIVDDQEIVKNELIICVPNVLEFIQQLARYHRDQLNIPIIGLTGSNGKTTTKELLNAVLKTRFNTFATHGNLNNHIGVPLSILSIKKETEIAVIEMGANHIGEISTLCSIAKPTYGLITNIGKAHLGEFGGFEGVKKAKSELYKYLSDSGGTVFINTSNQILTELAQKYNISRSVSYGFDTYKVTELVSKESFLTLAIEEGNNRFAIKTQLAGAYNIENVLAAICVGEYFGVSLYDAVDAIEKYTPTNSRSQIVETSKNTVIIDAYNANPSSMGAAIQNFALLATEKPKFAILGEMLELGEYGPNEHKIIAKLALESVGNVILVGQNFNDYSEGALHFNNQAECAEYIKSNSIVGYTILLKGSRGVRLDKLMELL